MKSKIEYENDAVVAFKDINPKAPIHLLIVPRRHIATLLESAESDKQLLGELLWASKKVAEMKGIAGYKIQINVGKEGGQEVEHVHLHFLANYGS